MWIKTADGWKALQPKICTPSEAGPEIYTGPIPSYECLAYVKGLEREHKEWVDRRKALVSS